ncbi:MAG: cyclic pyranopterin monophosphate synthase MoaC, partial [Spirochaetales bacterium]
MSHVDEQGRMRMVDISEKEPVKRTAKARGRITMQPATLELIRRNNIQKGDVLAAARLAGITGAKMTSNLIPLCHNIAIDAVHVDLFPGDGGIDITCTAVCTDKTGIEMEALTGT